MMTIDGSMGEGGGQVFRTSLSLSLLTRSPFRIVGIRTRRSKPGLLRQHLCALEAARTIGRAEVTGADIGSTEVTFRPTDLVAGDYRFATGGAGSTTLVFQTVLLPLLLGTTSPSTLSFSGGTHNPMAPPFDFLDRAFMPLLRRMGGGVDIDLHRYGFYPAGGGRFTAVISPIETLGELVLRERGEIRRTSATALVANVPSSVATRELDTLARKLGWGRETCEPMNVTNAQGSGNVVFATVESEHVTEVFTAFGERGVPAETVAERVATDVERYLRSGAAVFEHLADQLLLPMALGGGGSFLTVRPSLHTTTQIELLSLFGMPAVTTREQGDDAWLVEVPARTRSHDGR